MLREKLMKHMQKGKKLKPDEQEAKLDVLKNLRGQASSMMGDKVKGNKFGLPSDESDNASSEIEKAQMEVSSKSDMKEPDGLGEDVESEEHEAKELEGEKPLEECSPEELEQKIQMLMDLKKQKESK